MKDRNWTKELRNHNDVLQVDQSSLLAIQLHQALTIYLLLLTAPLHYQNSIMAVGIC